MCRTASVLIVLCLLPAAPGAKTQVRTPAAAERLALALQQRYQGILDFSADFVHTYRGGVLRTETTERGTVVIKKPGRMRWVYTSPERKAAITNPIRAVTRRSRPPV